jgi:DNA-binding PadR family transcriptional regulator
VVDLGPGTLYRTLAEMASFGLVVHPDAAPGGSDPRRKYYRLTPEGQELLTLEAERLARLVDVVRAQKVLPQPA